MHCWALLAVTWLALAGQTPSRPASSPAPAPQPAAPFAYYRWIDERGVVNYTQTPPPPGVREAPLRPDPSVPPVRATEEPAREVPAPGPWQLAIDAGLEAFRLKRFADAQLYFREALKEAARFPPADARLATTLDYLAAAYLSDEKFGLAESLLRRWLALAGPALGAEHPLMGEIAMRLGMALMGQKKHAPAEPWLWRALALAEQNAGPEHPQTVERVILLASLLTARKRWAEAEALHLRVVVSLEREDPERSLPGALVALGRFYDAQRRWGEAEAPYRRALGLLERDLGPDHPAVAARLDGLARVLRALGRPAEAVSLESRARVIRGAAAERERETRPPTGGR